MSLKYEAIDFAAVFQSAELRKQRKQQAEQAKKPPAKKKGGVAKIKKGSADVIHNPTSYQAQPSYQKNDRFKGNDSNPTHSFSKFNGTGDSRGTQNAHPSFNRTNNGARGDRGNFQDKKKRYSDRKGTKVFPSSERARGKKASEWNFDADYNDHFETSLQAVRDISPVLDKLCGFLKKRRDKLVIYDPYYCKGSIKEHFLSLGFPQVFNENRDFYRDITDGNIPTYDVLITNPPYTEDHKIRILDFCRKSGKPWALLMPNYIANKQYYLDFIQKHPGSNPFYIHPTSKYHYEHPEGTGHAESPFDSLWFVHLGGLTDQIFSSCKATARPSPVAAIQKVVEVEEEEEDSDAGTPRNSVRKRGKGQMGRGGNPHKRKFGSDKGVGGGGAVRNSGPAAAAGASGVEFVRTVEGLREGRCVPTDKRPNPRQRRKLVAKRMAVDGDR